MYSFHFENLNTQLKTELSCFTVYNLKKTFRLRSVILTDYILLQLWQLEEKLLHMKCMNYSYYSKFLMQFPFKTSLFLEKDLFKH